MLIQERFQIRAPIKEVWDFLLNLKEMAPCIPGVEKVEAIDPKTYTGVLKVKVGPISARFSGKATIVEIDPSTYKTAMVIQGADNSVASSVKGKMSLTLQERPDGEVEVLVDTDIDILGKLGQLGHGVIRPKAGAMMAEFANCVRARLSVPVEVEAPIEAAAAGPGEGLPRPALRIPFWGWIQRVLSWIGRLIGRHARRESHENP